MRTKHIKRFLFFAMALVVVFSLVPFFRVLATETEEQDHTSDTTAEVQVIPTVVPTYSEPEAADNTELLRAIQEQMDEILIKYLGKTVMTEEEVTDAVVNMPWDTMEAALSELDALNATADSLTEEEITQFKETYVGMDTIGYFYETLKLSTTPSAFAYTSLDLVPTTGVKVVVTDSSNNSGTKGTINEDTGVITVTAQGSEGGWFGWGAYSTTATITITNTLGEEAILTFDWSADSVKTLSPLIGTGGSGNVTLAAGGTYEITITTDTNSTVNTLTLSNFAIAAKTASYDVTFSYDDDLGDVQLNGIKVGTGVPQEISMADGAVTLKAVPASGKTFVAWTDAENKYLSSDLTYAFIPSGDMTVKAVFADSAESVFFRVAGILYDNYESAKTTAVNGSDKTIILAANGTLPAGSYEVPNGVTLLLPFDAADTLYAETPGNDNHATWVKPTPFRTLTMAEGAHITVAQGGAISLSARHHAGSAGQNAGSPTGPVSFIDMEDGSTITVKSGANLYAWGYITGDGGVTVENGGNVFENFQINDFRGGSHTASAVIPSRVDYVFPINSYYVQNIEVPMTLYAGATETGYSTIYADSSAVGTGVKFIASSGAMFNLTSGYLVKRYDGSTDRLMVEIYGNMTISPLALKLGGYDMDSTRYNLPINSNITVDAKSGEITVNQNLALLPGVVINIGENATFTLASGKNVYVYDSDQWKATYLYPQSARFKAVAYAPGRTYTRTDADLKDAEILVNGTLDASLGAIYTTENGANIYSTGSGIVKLKDGGATETHQVIKLGSNGGLTSATTEAINITSAQLKNEDGSYVATSSASSTTTYYYSHHACEHESGTTTVTHGVWYAAEHTDTATVTAPTCTEQGYTTYTCTCGHSYVDDEVAQLGHTEVTDPAKKPTVNETGLTEGSHCKTCGEVLVPQEELPMLIANVIYGTNIRIGDTLDLLFYVTSSKLSAEKSYVAVVTREKGGSTTSELVSQAEWEPYNTSYVRIRYDGIAAKEMTDTVTVTIHEANADGTAGNQVSETATDSIRGYAIRSLNNSANGDELRRTVIDMLNYGAAAQTHFGYETGDLANSDPAGSTAIKENIKYASTEVSYKKDSTDDNTEDFYGLNITLENNLYLNFYFKNVDSSTSAEFSYIKHNGDETGDTIPGDLFVSETGADGIALMGVQVKGLGIADGRVPITCTLSNNQTATASVEGYIAATIEQNPDNTTLIAVCENLMKFIDSAYAYFH